jgi:hypothetical protein
MLRFDVLELLCYIFILGIISGYFIMQSDKSFAVSSLFRV